MATGTTRSVDSSSINYSSHGHSKFWVDGAPMVHTEIKVNTGNIKNMYRKFNNTYTLNDKSGEFELEATLLNYDEGVLKRGDSLNVDFDGKQDTGTYYIYGHPDKFEFDYEQQYNNSALDGVLNILAMAGKYDIFEKNTHYDEYLSSVIRTEYDNATMTEKEIHPNPYNFDESESTFLLDAIKNYFAISTQDPELYNKIEDLIKEDGGGAINLYNPEDLYPYEHGTKTISDMLTTYGVDAHTEQLSIKGDVEPENEDTSEEEPPQGEEEVGGEDTETEETELNSEKYDFAVKLAEYVKEGKGVMVIGNGFNLVNDTWVNGDTIAMNIVGCIEGYVYDSEGNPTGDTDIYGFYVIETAGYLSNTNSAQFVTVKKLYDFLIGSAIGKLEKDDVFDTTIVVTDDEIRSWADKMNLIGNNGRNYLTGNESDNILDGKASSDMLYGRGGNDTLLGGSEHDTLSGGSGDDYLDGGSGNDTYVFMTDDGVTHDTIVLGSGKDTLIFQDASNFSYYKDMNGNMIIRYTNGTETEQSSILIKDYFKKNLYNNLTGICFKKDLIDSYHLIDIKMADGEMKNFLRDVLYNNTVITNLLEQNKVNKVSGTKLNDAFKGGYRNDTISAGDGDDTIYGAYGNDSIKGGNGNDYIKGSTGNDKIYGEAGTNTIVYDSTESAYGGNDTIYSGSGKDFIRLNDVDSSQVTFAKNGNNLTLHYQTSDANPLTGSITIADYFKKQGNTSIKRIQFKESDDYLQLADNATYQQILGMVSATDKRGDDKINGTDGNDRLSGELGNDIIKAKNGNDTLIGGLGDDKLYGQGGNNTYVFDEYLSGQDTIYTSGNGKTTIDFSALDDIIFDASGLQSRADDMFDDTCTRYKNDLILNYGRNNDEIDGSKITISNFFKAKGAFEIINGDDSIFDLKQLILNIKGETNKKNSLTGTFMNDYIVGGNLNDKINGGSGNDTIIGGLGNDTITGGTGTNTIIYNKGDGNDTINLTKGENLTIDMKNFSGIGDLNFSKVKNDIVISYLDDNNNTQKLLLKNFGTKDVTAGGNVTLKVGTETLDLRKDAYLPAYTTFTSKKSKYNGTWHSDIIDASSLDSEIVKKDKGANINAGAGNDIIYGSMYNDTIKGGDGDDIIYSNGGKDSIDGGNGSDTYYLFNGAGENTTINDTGISGKDIGVICDEIGNLSNYDIYFNFKKDGSFDSIHINDKVLMKGVEALRIQTSDGELYEFNTNNIQSQIEGWLNGYDDIQTAIDNGSYLPDDNPIYQAFQNSDNWTAL